MSFHLRLGLENALSRIEKSSALYDSVLAQSQGCKSKLFNLAESPLFEKVIEMFGPVLRADLAKVNLANIYDAALHLPTHSLIVASRGVSLFCRSPITSTPFLMRHLACCVYKPGLGLEAVNVGLVGSVYDGSVILRAESACPPSFLFGSQRCNCSYQWNSIKELAAHFNTIKPPENLGGDDFETWVQEQFLIQGNRHIPKKPGRGLVLLHLDSQAGMGSGQTDHEFVQDLYSRALMRQLGENTSEQLHHLSIKEGYESLGLSADARRLEGEAGYQIPAIVLDYLDVSKQLIVLSNNRYKLGQLAKHGYEIKRVKSLGKVDAAGEREARQRGVDFAHLDMNGAEITFEEEIRRLKEECIIQ